MKDLKEMLKLGFILMLICFVSALILAGTYKITSPKIAQQKINLEKEALKNITGHVLKVRAKGYSGNIDMLVGVDENGAITAVEILSHQETSGLGAHILDKWFLGQFVGKIASRLNMSDIQAISGATISSKAVMEAIKNEVK